MSDKAIGIASIVVGVLIGAFGHSLESPFFMELFVSSGVLLMIFGGVGVLAYDQAQ